MDGLYYIRDIATIKRDTYSLPQAIFATFICRSGEAEMSIGDKVYKVCQGVVCIFVPFSVVRLLSHSVDWDGMLVEGDFDFVMSTISKVPVSRRQAVRTMPCVMATPEQCRRLWRLVDVISERESLPRVDNDMGMMDVVVMRLMQALMLEILHIYFIGTPIDDLPLSKGDMIYNRFIASVLTNCCRERTVTYYAREQHLSNGYFSAVIKGQSGQTPLKWIEDITMTQIYQLMSQRDRSIKEIAVAMNFPEQSSFGRFFKSHAGMSPSEYRSKMSQ